MKTDTQVLDYLKRTFGSDTASAAELGVTKAQLSNWRHRHGAIGAPHRLKVYKLCMRRGYKLPLSWIEHPGARE